MSRRTVLKSFIVALMLGSVLPLGAQNEAYNAYTPYSMFGIGDISKAGGAFNKSMGGVGIATRDSRFLNYLNPAAVTERDEKSFMVDFSLAEGNRYYSQKDYTSADNTFNIYDFTISFPVYKSFAMYAGFNPYSDVGYEMTSSLTDQDVIGNTGNITSTAQGYGGLSQIFLGGGINICKGLSAGAEVQFVFGTLNKKNIQTFSNTSYRSIYSGYIIKPHAPTVKFGAQYETPKVGSVSAILGATYKLSSKLHGTVQDYEISSISSVTDTSRNNITKLGSSGVKLADELGVGIALKGGEKWTAEVNYLRSDWSKSGMATASGFANVGTAVFGASASQSVRAGFSLIPNKNDIRYYSKRITYRGGAYWDQAYYTLDGNSVNTVGLTFGVTLPVYARSSGATLIDGVTLGVDLGQRGYRQDNMIRERFINFNIGLNLSEIWFLKQKYN